MIVHVLGPECQRPMEDLDCPSKGSVFLKCCSRWFVCLQLSTISLNQFFARVLDALDSNFVIGIGYCHKIRLVSSKFHL